MNETLSIYLDFDIQKRGIESMEPMLLKMDEIIKKYGWKYSGMMNLYLPMDEKERDETIYEVIKALSNTEWLKPYKPCIMMGNWMGVTELLKIDVSKMVAPSEQKMKRYEEFYLNTHTLTHGIIVDENGELRDGYTSYLLAMKYDVDVEIMEAWSFKPVKKVVRGNHVTWDGKVCEDKGDKQYCWIYNLREAVVLGDILTVRTKKGYDYIRVSKIGYVTGNTACSRYRKVIRNETADL
ncbi:MAG: hypothetical protein PHE02_02085 [Lachnospiraceae bacterium]|nr:hypothetical protein [Lachnospiraceae bacterium]